jgi:hypothetical protein
MERMIELHPEARHTRKRFQCSRFYIRVTDSAYGTTGIRELLRMAASARQMTIRSGQLRNKTRITTMTKQARQARVVPAAVLKLGVVEAFGKLHLVLIRH